MPETPPTSGPIVDAISRYWSELGKVEGEKLGEAEGFNTGLRLVFADVKNITLLEADKALPSTLKKNVAVSPRPDFPCIPITRPPDRAAAARSGAGEDGPCLEQIWYDIGFDLGRQQAYGAAIQLGMASAYEHLRTLANVLITRRLPPPA